MENSPHSRRWLRHPSTTSRTFNPRMKLQNLEFGTADSLNPSISTMTDISTDSHSPQAIGRVWKQAHDSAPSRGIGRGRSYRYRSSGQLPTRGDGKISRRGMAAPNPPPNICKADEVGHGSMKRNSTSRSHSQSNPNL